MKKYNFNQERTRRASIEKSNDLNEALRLKLTGQPKLRPYGTFNSLAVCRTCNSRGTTAPRRQCQTARLDLDQEIQQLAISCRPLPGRSSVVWKAKDRCASQTGNAILTYTENLGHSHLGEFTSLPEFLQRHFFGDQTASTGLDLLATRGTYSLHFLVRVFTVISSFSSSAQIPIEPLVPPSLLTA